MEIVQTVPVDVLVLDMGLPGMSGTDGRQGAPAATRDRDTAGPADDRLG